MKTIIFLAVLGFFSYQVLHSGLNVTQRGVQAQRVVLDSI